MSNRNNENELKVMNENELIVVMYMAEKQYVQIKSEQLLPVDASSQIIVQIH